MGILKKPNINPTLTNINHGKFHPNPPFDRLYPRAISYSHIHIHEPTAGWYFGTEHWHSDMFMFCDKRVWCVSGYRRIAWPILDTWCLCPFVCCECLVFFWHFDISAHIRIYSACVAWHVIYVQFVYQCNVLQCVVYINTSRHDQA